MENKKELKVRISHGTIVAVGALIMVLQGKITVIEAFGYVALFYLFYAIFKVTSEYVLKKLE